MELELKDFLKIVRTRKLVIISAVLVVTLTALAISFIQPPQYVGESRVLITERAPGAALLGNVIPEITGQPERALETQVQLLQMRPLLENTIRELNLGVTPRELEGRIQVSAVGRTNIILVSVRDSDPARAAAIANEVAEQFVSWSRDHRRESIAAAVDQVDARLTEVEDAILTFGRKVQDEGRTEELAAELQVALSTYSSLSQERENLRIQEQLETGSARVVSPAVINEDPISPNPLRNAILALAIGLALGLGLAMLSEYLDNTLKSSEEVESIFGAPVLGMIPLEKLEDTDQKRLTIVDRPGSFAAEAYRVLRNSLDFVNFEHNIKTLLITSAAPVEGKSTVSANLAASLAQTGQNVVLISCDFRRPTTDRLFGLQNIIGLSDVLRGAHTLKSALQRPGDEHLLVLTAGKMPPNPSEILGSTKMQELIENLKEWADWIILDTPPLLAVADATALARWADGTLIVTRGGVSTRDAAVKARDMLDMVGAKIIGSVVWGLEEKYAEGGYGYYGQYSYSAYYQQPEATNRSGNSKRGHDSGARTVVNVRNSTEMSTPSVYFPQETGLRKAIRTAQRVVVGVLGVTLVLIVVAAVLYIFDHAFGWQIIENLVELLP